MTTRTRLIPLVLAVFAASALAGSPGLGQEARISVTGEAKVAAAPDMAVIRVGVSEEAPTAAEALALMNERGESILARLSEAGIEGRDIQTSDLTVGPIYDPRSDGYGEKITGFSAQTLFVVRVRQIDALGQVIDSVVRAGGANLLRSVSFTLAEPRPAMDDARRAAVADGRAKAELLAEAAGVTLGPLVSLDEGFGSGMPMPALESFRMDAAGAVPIAQGEVMVEAQVTMVYAIMQ